MSVRRALREARKICAREFEPLWKPAPFVPMPRYREMSPLDRANVAAAAKGQAFAWLSAQLGVQIQSFDELADLALLRRAFALIWNASMTDVRRWAEARALEAGCDG